MATRTYPRHVHLTFGGDIDAGGSTVEEWSCGIRIAYDMDLQRDHDVTVEECEEYLTNVAVPALRTWFADGDLGIATGTSLSWVKANAIGANGKYIHDQTVQAAGFGKVVGVGGLAVPLKYPLQVSLAVTFETDVSRGLASKGRIFLPTPTHPLAANGQFDLGRVGNVAVLTANLLTALDTNNATGLDFTPSVISGGNAIRNGVAREIRRVSVDTRPDVQRSRANDLVGQRYTANVA